MAAWKARSALTPGPQPPAPSRGSARRACARRLTSSPAIHRITPRRDEERYVVVLLGRRNAHANRCFLQKRRIGERDAARPEVVCELESELVAPATQPVALKKRCGASPIDTRRLLGNERWRGTRRIVNLDAYTGGRYTGAG